jgi:hypothetical protein
MNFMKIRYDIFMRFIKLKKGLLEEAETCRVRTCVSTELQCVKFQKKAFLQSLWKDSRSGISACPIGEIEP